MTRELWASPHPKHRCWSGDEYFVLNELKTQTKKNDTCDIKYKTDTLNHSTQYDHSGSVQLCREITSAFLISSTPTWLDPYHGITWTVSDVSRETPKHLELRFCPANPYIFYIATPDVIRSIHEVFWSVSDVRPKNPITPRLSCKSMLWFAKYKDTWYAREGYCK